jgi:DMSO/TMAO reductase YedYZ molybdopterin-dependent catalytic subunit
MIIREKDPANLEMPFAALDGFITPNEQFYIRSHFAVPEVPDLASWRLRVEGAVERERAWSFDELRALPATTITATMECAGNSRVFLVPKAKGVQWEMGAVGNAEWTGVSLGEVLRQAG